MRNRPVATHVVAVIHNTDLTTVQELYDYLTRKKEYVGYDVNGSEMRHGLTALHAACVAGKDQLVLALLTAGANPNQTTNDLDTPLNYALKANSAACVRHLLAHGARIDALTSKYSSDTAYAVAIRDTMCNEIRDLMKSHAAALQIPEEKLLKPDEMDFMEYEQSIRKRDEEHKNDFLAAVRAHELVKAKEIYNAHKMDVTRLVTFVDVDPMTDALEKGDLDVVRLLVECGDFVLGQCQYPDDKTFVDTARQHGHEDVADYLESVQASRYAAMKALLQPEKAAGYTPALFQPAAVEAVRPVGALRQSGPRQ